MTHNILVTYATRTGSTQGVAEAIAEVLQSHGAEVTVDLIQDVESLAPYDAVVAGSAINASQWLPEALEFLHMFKAELEQKPFAAFLVCMTMAMNNPDFHKQAQTFMQPVRDVVQPDEEGFFAGILDIGQAPYWQARIGFRISTLLGVWKQGDHRDWAKIRAWAEAIYPALTANGAGR